jgi:hypothetical protein
MMESEIKLAWMQGFRQALIFYSEIEPDRREALAEEAWHELCERVSWNDRRIMHRDS